MNVIVRVVDASSFPFLPPGKFIYKHLIDKWVFKDSLLTLYINYRASSPDPSL